jgi:hypothetical protein
MDQSEFRQRAMIAAMQGLLASSVTWSVNTPHRDIAKASASLADALLAANTIDEPEPTHD